MSIFTDNLSQNSTNYTPLSPVDFLYRAAQCLPNKTAIVYGERRYSYRQFWQRSCQLASALTKRGLQAGDCISIMGANTPEMLEAHNAIPMMGAVLNSLNIRLDAQSIGFILNHAESKVILVDQEFAPIVKAALASVERELLVVDIRDALAPEHAPIGSIDYESLLAEGDSADTFPPLADEWQAVSLLYTSGTTGNPKGCVYHARGAYLNALGNMVTLGLSQSSHYLWVLPMFHCDGWTFTWGVTAAMATHVCLRKPQPELIYDAIREQGITHMCGAPIIMNMLANTKQPPVLESTVHIMTGGAAPPASVTAAMEKIGFRVIHAYGLTETYGPALHCLEQPQWQELDHAELCALRARQGIPYVTLRDISVKNAETMQDVPRDGKTIGELMLRGNTIMKGYLKNPQATDACFAGDWFHSGDLAVWHPDGYVEVKDRAKDIIISGGENISTLEVESVLYHHPKVLEAAVVAKPDDYWGEIPCAFVTLHPGQLCEPQDIIDYCRANMAHFKIPRLVVFSELPKTSTGKIQKFLLREQAKALSL